MTRASIEVGIKIFLFALICVFFWAVYKVLLLLGAI